MSRRPAQAQRAMRDVIQHALGQHELTQRDLRVLLALVYMIPLFDRGEDRVANSQLVSLTGIDQRHVRRSLANLSKAGVIVRDPGVGKLASHVRFPLLEGAKLAPSEGADSDIERGPEETFRGGSYGPASESSSVSSSGDSCDVCFGAHVVELSNGGCMQCQCVFTRPKRRRSR